LGFGSLTRFRRLCFIDTFNRYRHICCHCYAVALPKTFAQGQELIPPVTSNQHFAGERLHHQPNMLKAFEQRRQGQARARIFFEAGGRGPAAS